MVQYVHQFLRVGFLLALDRRAGPVVFPEVGVAAVLEEGFGGDGGGGGVFFCVLLGGVFGDPLLGGCGRRGRWRGGGLVFGWGFFVEEVSEGGIEVAEGIFIVVGGFAAVAEPA